MRNKLTRRSVIGLLVGISVAGCLGNSTEGPTPAIRGVEVAEYLDVSLREGDPPTLSLPTEQPDTFLEHVLSVTGDGDGITYVHPQALVPSWGDLEGIMYDLDDPAVDVTVEDDESGIALLSAEIEGYEDGPLMFGLRVDDEKWWVGIFELEAPSLPPMVSITIQPGVSDGRVQITHTAGEALQLDSLVVFLLADDVTVEFTVSDVLDGHERITAGDTIEIEMSELADAEHSRIIIEYLTDWSIPLAAADLR